jgi:hypothetical protein
LATISTVASPSSTMASVHSGQAYLPLEPSHTRAPRPASGEPS